MATYVITGANRGIGCEYCRQLTARGDCAERRLRQRAIAVCRQASEELKSIAGVTIIEGIDITDDRSVASLRERLGDLTIDVLINNAGIIESVTLKNLDFDSIRRQFEVNALGALRVTHMLLPLLKSGSKIILMTSRMGSIAEGTLRERR